MYYVLYPSLSFPALVMIRPPQASSLGPPSAMGTGFSPQTVPGGTQFRPMMSSPRPGLGPPNANLARPQPTRIGPPGSGATTMSAPLQMGPPGSGTAASVPPQNGQAQSANVPVSGTNVEQPLKNGGLGASVVRAMYVL